MDCIFSEPAAAKRVAAVRLIRRWPGIQKKDSHWKHPLTGLYMVGKHLTEENYVTVLMPVTSGSKRWWKNFCCGNFTLAPPPRQA